jgi:hypothetical protein
MSEASSHTFNPSASDFAAPPAVGRLQMVGLVVGVVGAVLCAVGYTTNPTQFFHSWLLGCALWVGVSAGCLALSMIHNLTGGTWGTPARRVFEAAAGVLPLLLVLFVPILFGLQDLYLWARPEAADDPVLAHKAPYLNADAYTLRYVVYFAIWIAMAWMLRRLSLAQDRKADPAISKRMAVISAPGLVIWAFVTTFAYFDWLMSLDPHWFSTIYGVYFFGGSGLSALAFLILISLFLSRRKPMDEVLAPRHFHDWGKLLFAFVLLWAYFAVSQFLITWSGNLPEEIEWYLHRTQHGWGGVALALVLFHFAVPFALLLSRDLKKNARRLAVVAGFLLVMRWLDVLWQIGPSLHPELAVHWLDVAAPLAVGGLWLAAFVWLLRRHPVVPIHDPYLEESLGDGSH